MQVRSMGTLEYPAIRSYLDQLRRFGTLIADGPDPLSP
jgi:hypothetical protein